MSSRGFIDISDYFPSLPPSLAFSSPALPSVFLVTVYPLEGSGNTNRLSLPCGFSSSSSSSTPPFLSSPISSSRSQSCCLSFSTSSHSSFPLLYSPLSLKPLEPGLLSPVPTLHPSGNWSELHPLRAVNYLP